MFKHARDRVRFLLNALDRTLHLHIFPRDRVFTASLPTLAHAGKRSLLLDTGRYGFDMFYYASSFIDKNKTYLCFHATRLRSDGTSSSHIIITDASQTIVWSLAADDVGLDHFYSPQVLLEKKCTLFFCARTGDSHALYSMDITGFVTRSVRKLRTGPREQTVFTMNKRTFVMFKEAKNATFNLFMMSGTRFRSIPVRFRVHSAYVFLSNPSIAIDGKTIHLFCRLSTNNALGSRIVSFTSSDVRTFTQTSFSIKPRKDIEHHATAFPSVVNENGLWRLYYTGYWGRHLLEKNTVRHWSNYSEEI